MLSLYDKNRRLLYDLMAQVQIADLDELSRVANVSRLQLIRLEQGLILKISLGTIAKIAKALQISVDNLLDIFASDSSDSVIERTANPSAGVNERAELEACRQEYQKLQQQLEQQQAILESEFQQTSLQTIESWLLQWPTAAAAVQKNPQLPAARLLTLVEPIEQLLEHWGVSTIASVGEELAYNPQQHQLMKGTAEPGEMVEVRYVGYQQGDKLLYKAKVSPLPKTEN